MAWHGSSTWAGDRHAAPLNISTNKFFKDVIAKELLVDTGHSNQAQRFKEAWSTSGSTAEDLAGEQAQGFATSPASARYAGKGSLRPPSPHGHHPSELSSGGLGCQHALVYQANLARAAAALATIEQCPRK